MFLLCISDIISARTVRGEKLLSERSTCGGWTSRALPASQTSGLVLEQKCGKAVGIRVAPNESFPLPFPSHSRRFTALERWLHKTFRMHEGYQISHKISNECYNITCFALWFHKTVLHHILNCQTGVGVKATSPSEQTDNMWDKVWDSIISIQTTTWFDCAE